MRFKKPQLQLLKKDNNREHGRPIVTNHTMHLVLRSTKADLRDYIRINVLEGAGAPRAIARFLIRLDKVLNST